MTNKWLGLFASRRQTKYQCLSATLSSVGGEPERDRAILAWLMAGSASSGSVSSLVVFAKR